MGLALRGAADPSWTALFSPFPTEASFCEGALSLSHTGHSPPALVPGAVFSAQPAPGPCARISSPEPGQLLPLLGHPEGVKQWRAEINPCWRSLNTRLSRACSRARGAPQCLGFQCRSSVCSPRAAGAAKSLMQATDITSVTDRDNLENRDMPRSLFHKMVLIDTNDNSPFQTFINQIRSGPFLPSAQD